VPADGFENPIDPAGVAYATRRGDLDLINFANIFIFNLTANGTVLALKEKWVRAEYVAAT
jgi:hypothetical protein